MYESRAHDPLPAAAFATRVVIHLVAACGLLVVSLAFGMVGYVMLEGMSTTDAFLNAAMLLGGMGPVNPPVTTAGKLFAGAYALYAGLVFIVSAGLILTPIAHRMLHVFHWDGKV